MFVRKIREYVDRTPVLTFVEEINNRQKYVERYV
jgi:hypothetical protein